MSVYLVTWNLNKEGAAYSQARDAFLRQLGTYENTKDDALETVRFVSTSSTASTVSDHLRQKLDDNDRLFVTKLDRGNHQGWLSKSTWEWINARL